ncbi:N-acetylmuramoyl-L-alanine amidase [Calothrix sp. 336/3]|nr:N-acetylmuramoyl-L-alanine amidase [Calothrix sp. 336/3]
MKKLLLLICSMGFLVSSYPTVAQQKNQGNLVQLSQNKVKNKKPLSGTKIIINPGHGGEETGAVGATGYFAKDANLQVSKLLAEELRQNGAIVVMTRDDDRYLSLGDRQAIIKQEEPTIAITIHYTLAADGEDAEKVQGIRAFWYHPQSQGLAVFIHNSLTRKLGRASGGVFWNNLALTRPDISPSVVLELGFFSNPQEFEWITNTQEQRKLATVLAQSITEWLQKTQKSQ